MLSLFPDNMVSSGPAVSLFQAITVVCLLTSIFVRTALAWHVGHIGSSDTGKSGGEKRQSHGIPEVHFDKSLLFIRFLVLDGRLEADWKAGPLTKAGLQNSRGGNCCWQWCGVQTSRPGIWMVWCAACPLRRADVAQLKAFSHDR